MAFFSYYQKHPLHIPWCHLDHMIYKILVRVPCVKDVLRYCVVAGSKYYPRAILQFPVGLTLWIPHKEPHIRGGCVQEGDSLWQSKLDIHNPQFLSHKSPLPFAHRASWFCWGKYLSFQRTSALPTIKTKRGISLMLTWHTDLHPLGGTLCLFLGLCKGTSPGPNYFFNFSHEGSVLVIVQSFNPVCQCIRVEREQGSDQQL